MTSITVRGGHITVTSLNAPAVPIPADRRTCAPVCLASQEMAEHVGVGCLLKSCVFDAKFIFNSWLKKKRKSRTHTVPLHN